MKLKKFIIPFAVVSLIAFIALQDLNDYRAKLQKDENNWRDAVMTIESGPANPSLAEKLHVAYVMLMLVERNNEEDKARIIEMERLRRNCRGVIEED